MASVVFCERKPPHKAATAGGADATKMEIPFPYTPYPQQKALMNEIYSCIEESKFGVFESPTGTGKSMSAICASLHWLTITENAIISKEVAVLEDAKKLTTKASTDDDWFVSLLGSSNSKQSTGDVASMPSLSAAAISAKDRALERYNTMKERIRKAGLRDTAMTLTGTHGGYAKSHALSASSASKPDVMVGSKASNLDDEFGLPTQYDSDQATRNGKKTANHGISSDDEESTSGDDNDDDLQLPQIIYCSRTHSQISQFVGEIKKSPFSNVRCITLGSRKTMCINDSVRQLQSDAAMSERCLELQKSKSKSASSTTTATAAETGEKLKKSKTLAAKVPCSFRRKRDEPMAADKALSTVRDIEELAELGKAQSICPYYTSRKAVRDAQVICAPYNILLHKDLRTSMGIRLTGNVVIFDEAHNLIDSINHTYSAEVSLSQLNLADAAIKAYTVRFEAMLSGKNLYYVNIFKSVISRMLQSLVKGVDKAPKSISGHVESSFASGSGVGSTNTATTSIMGANSYIFFAGLDNINLFKLQKYLELTRLVTRIGGFADHAQSRTSDNAVPAAVNTAPPSSDITAAANDMEPANSSRGSHIAALRSVAALLGCLTNTESDGRISITFPSSTTERASVPDAANNSTANTTVHVHSKSSSDPRHSQQPHIKFVLFNPAQHFQKLVDCVRSVVLLGGTLKPFSFVVASLFNKATIESKVRTYSCDHVVRDDRVSAIILPMGPSGRQLTLTHDNRNSPGTLAEIFGSLIEISSSVPHGIVVFFTSYAYMEAFMSFLKSGDGVKYRKLHAVKPIFVEPRSATDGERVWTRYSLYATSTTAGGTDSRGAVLFCVMGGKLSEGINFSDNLARCVVVVGMPYPDGRDPLLMERMKYADSKQDPEHSGKQLYEAICMKAVNQSIGRSIRHAMDYAAIVLLDARYATPRVRDQLPGWIGRSLVTANSFNEIKPRLNGFFERFTSSSVVAKHQ